MIETNFIEALRQFDHLVIGQSLNLILIGLFSVLLIKLNRIYQRQLTVAVVLSAISVALKVIELIIILLYLGGNTYVENLRTPEWLHLFPDLFLCIAGLLVVYQFYWKTDELSEI